MALVARHMVGMPDNKADAPMPLVDEVGRHIVCRLHIIHENRACQRVIGPWRDADEANSAPFQFLERSRCVGNWRRQDHPVDMGLVNQATDFLRQCR